MLAKVCDNGLETSHRTRLLLNTVGGTQGIDHFTSQDHVCETCAKSLARVRDRFEATNVDHGCCIRNRQVLLFITVTSLEFTCLSARRPSDTRRDIFDRSFEVTVDCS